MPDIKQILTQIDSILLDVDRAKSASHFDDYSGGLADDELATISVRLLAAITRFSSTGSVYYQQAEKVKQGLYSHTVKDLGAILRALRADIDAGYVQSLGEMARAEIFADFLAMAEELQQKGYKDAAAVISGSVLEGHLRKLALKYNIAIAKSDGSPKKADALNIQLATLASAYNALQQKSVVAWLDLRNSAAHGNYTSYDHKQVAALIRDIGDFMIRYPA